MLCWKLLCWRWGRAAHRAERYESTQSRSIRNEYRQCKKHKMWPSNYTRVTRAEAHTLYVQEWSVLSHIDNSVQGEVFGFRSCCSLELWEHTAGLLQSSRGEAIEILSSTLCGIRAMCVVWQALNSRRSLYLKTLRKSRNCFGKWEPVERLNGVELIHSDLLKY